MKNEFIPYEQALALKELGFDEPCFRWFNKIHKTLTEVQPPNGNLGYCKSPLYQQAFRWFRDKHGLYHSIGLDNSLENDVNCDYQIINHSQSISEHETNFNNYEEAEQACLEKLIEIVINKN